MTNRKRRGLTLLLLPGGALLLMLVAQIIVRFALTNTSKNTESLCQVTAESALVTGCEDDQAASSGIVKVVNVFSIIVGALSVIGFLPLGITGIILLATPSKAEIINNDDRVQ